MPYCRCKSVNLTWCRWPQEVWTLRNCLMFLVHNLQCYLQLDVLESEYSIFQAALDKTEDFDQVIHEHSIFLKNITTQAFLFPTKVRFHVVIETEN